VTNGITNCLIADIIFAAADEVFSSMLACKIKPVEEYSAPQEVPHDGVVSVVGLTGAWVGNGYLTCTAPTASLLASRFLMTEVDGVNDEVLDALGELTNMIVGGAKNNLEEHLGAMQLSIPTVVCGTAIRSHLVKSEIAQTVVCGADDWEIGLRICLSRAQNGARH
jgi:chemotaxis protein CheX